MEPFKWRASCSIDRCNASRSVAKLLDPVGFPGPTHISGPATPSGGAFGRLREFQHSARWGWLKSARV
jgi:hypothetical protein